MSKINERILELMGQGYHCSQIMMLLSMDLRERENPELIRALGPLGGGMFCRKTCGTLTGAVCVMGTYCPRGEGEPEPTEYQEMAKELVKRFEETNGSTVCADLVEFKWEKIMEYCPGLMERTFADTLSILEAHGKDIYE